MKKFIKDTYPFSLILILGLYCFYILLYNGFNGDDAYNAQINGKLIDESLSLFELLYRETKDWFVNSRRILLGYFFVLPLFYFTQDFFLIKLITISVIVLSISFFYISFNIFLKNKKLLLLAVLILFICIQFRNWHDPILIFPSHLIPFLALCFFASLFFYNKFLIQNKKFFLFLSVFLYACSIFLYELNIGLFPIFLIFDFHKSKNLYVTFKNLKFHLFSIFIYLLILFYAHYTFPENIINSYPVFAESDFSQFFHALMIQLTAGLPGIYYLAQKSTLIFSLNYLDFIFLILLSCIFYTMLKDLTFIKLTRSNLLLLISSSAILIFIPSLIAALSSHQSELISAGLGYGYSPVYYQYFGTSILIVILIYALSKSSEKFRFHFFIVFFLSIFLSTCLVIFSSFNRQVAEETNKTHKYPQELQFSATSSSLFNDISADDTLIRSMRFANDWKWSYFSLLNKKINICDYLNQNYANGDDFLMKLKDCIIKSDFTRQDISKNISIITPKKSTWFVSYFIDMENGEKGKVFLARADKIYINNLNYQPIFSESKNYKIYLQENDSVKEIDSKINFVNILDVERSNNISQNIIDKNEDFFFFLDGLVHPKEVSLDSSLNWISGKFNLHIYNRKSKFLRVKINFDISNPINQKLNIKFTNTHDQKIIFDKLIENSQKNFEIDTILSPGENIIKVTSDGHVIENGDPRNIIYGILNIIISERNFK